MDCKRYSMLRDTSARVDMVGSIFGNILDLQALGDKFGRDALSLGWSRVSVVLEKAWPGSHVSPVQVSTPAVEIPTRKLCLIQDGYWREG